MGRLPRIVSAAMGAAARRPLLAGLVVTVLALLGTALALRLHPATGTDTFVGKSSTSWQATERDHELFGEDAVYVLVRQPVAKLVLTQDLDQVIGLEGCLGGNVPAGRTPPGGWGGPCGRLAKAKPVKVVYGPGTFINESVRQIGDAYDQRLAEFQGSVRDAYSAAYQLAKSKGYSAARAKQMASQAAQLAQVAALRDAIKLATTYGVLEKPTINDPAFVAKLVFATGKKAGTPKARFAYLFPNASSSLIQVRLKPGLGEGERQAAIDDIRAAAGMSRWALHNGGQYVVTGAPVVLSDLTHEVSDAIVLLLVASLVVMGLVLALVFPGRLRLLPLVVALAAAAVTFGGLSLAGASLTLASVGVAPVLIGLAVDYAIQLQSRIEERSGARPSRRGVREAVAEVARSGAPTVAVAACATAAGFLVLALSPVPMVRGFGVLLVIGIGVALAVALTFGTAVLVGTADQGPAAVDADAAAGARGSRGGALRRAGAGLRRAGGIVAPALHGAGDIVRDNPASRALVRGGVAARRGAIGAAMHRPGRVLGAALAVAALGWVVDTQTRVESDVTKLVPQNLPALSDLRALQRSTQVGGQIDVLVRSDRLTDPAVMTWMTRYQQRLLKRFGYSARRGCGQAEVCPAFSLPDLFGDQGPKSQKAITELLDAVPSYFSQGVITPDRRTATIAFGIRLMPLDRQKEVIDVMRSELHPPPGVSAQLAGLPVLAADANAAIASPWRRLLTLLAGLAAVGLVLLAAFRSWRRAVVPLVPIVLATGWSALLLFASRIPLNPMSVTMGALVIAISTEFSVLLAERYRAERLRGHDPALALERTYRSTGAAVLASGVTAIAGFAVLALSDIRMLRDFGAVTVLDLTVSLLGVLLVLPAALVLGERPDALRALVPRLRRGDRDAAGEPARVPAG